MAKYISYAPLKLLFYHYIVALWVWWMHMAKHQLALPLAVKNEKKKKKIVTLEIPPKSSAPPCFY